MGTGRDLAARRKNGEIFPVEVGLNPISTSAGQLVLCAIIDLTERKNFEEKILKQSQQLADANRQLAEQATTDPLTNLNNCASIVR